MEVRLFYLVVSLFFGLAVSFSASGAKFQPVYSLKNLGEQKDASGNSFERVQVKCNTGRELKYLHRDAGNERWCVTGNATECFLERIDAATSACSVDRRSIKAPDIASTPVVKKPSAEQLRKQAERDDLQAELMINQQKKIELRTQQLELRKRELELKAQRDNS